MSYLKKYDFSLLKEVFAANYESRIVNWKNIFNNENGMIVEIGCGNGHFIINKALENQDCNFIGIDKKNDRIIRCREKQLKQNITNIRFIAGDAFCAISNMFQDNSISNIYMIFPDPWPKRKHHKNRLFKSEFLQIIHEKLFTNGQFTFVTDYKEYFDETYSITKNDVKFSIIMDNLNEDFSATLFGQKWEKENREFYGFTFKKL